MSLLEQKKDFSKRGSFDELYTPDEAVKMILPYIPKDVKTITLASDEIQELVRSLPRTLGGSY